MSSSSRRCSRPRFFARDASGARQRIRHAAFPAHKTLEDFDFSAQPGAEKPLILHLAQLTSVANKGPPALSPAALASKGAAIALGVPLRYCSRRRGVNTNVEGGWM